MTFTNKFKDLKKFYTIFIIIILFLNTALISSLHANSFKISDIEVSQDFNLDFNKKKVFDEAFKAAYAQLISTIITSKDKKKIEKINLAYIKSKYIINSKVQLLNYTINLNTREIIAGRNKLKLTEREKDFLLFLKNSKKPQKIRNILKLVWKYSKGIETHTVETHVHRLRKKFLDSFNDNNFIKNNKKGYYI